MLTNPLYSGFTCLFIYFSVFEMYYSGDFCLVYPFYLSNALYLWNTGGWWQLHWGAWARGNDGAEWMERYKTYCFYVFDNIPFTPFRPLWWAVLPLAASAGVNVYECVPDTGKDGIEVCSRSWGREGGLVTARGFLSQPFMVFQLPTVIKLSTLGLLINHGLRSGPGQ